MEIVTVLIIAALAMLLGFVVAWLFASKKKKAPFVTEKGEKEMSDISSVKNPVLIEESKDLEDKALLFKKKLELKSSELEELQQKENSLQAKLDKKEAELLRLKADLENLSLTPSELNENEIIITLKNNLAAKNKELEEKEEEIADLEDEISSIKKKLKQLKREYDNATEEQLKIAKELKSTQLFLEEKVQEYDDLKEDSDLKAEAIEFVNAILNAKPIEDRDVLTHLAKVQKVENIVLDQYIALQNTYFNDVEGKDKLITDVRKIIAKWGNLQRKSWLKGKKVIAFIGEFSAGKTSIVNRILSQDDPDCPKLPVSSKATTAIATYISYGATFISQFADPNGDVKHIERTMFEKVNKDILSRINVSSLIRHFVMKYNNENLKGLSILDTPGFSSNDEEDQSRTLDVINEADALFWVMDANSGEINRTSLKIIADNLGDLPLYIIINKADTKSPKELDKLETHIRQTMQRAEINVQGYLRFSQKEKLDALMQIVKNLPESPAGKDIIYICKDLQLTINAIADVIKGKKSEIRESEKILSQLNDDIESLLDSQQEWADRIKSIPQHNSRWFRADDYRMEEDEYNELNNLCESVAENSIELQSRFEETVEIQVIYSQEKADLTEFKEIKSATENVNKQLLNAIKGVDEKLYIEIINSIKDSSSEAQSYQDVQDIKNSEHTVQNSSDTSAHSKVDDWYRKGCDLKRKGQKEEAIWWFKKAAKAGNKNARNECKYYGVRY